MMIFGAIAANVAATGQSALDQKRPVTGRALSKSRQQLPAGSDHDRGLRLWFASALALGVRAVAVRRRGSWQWFLAIFAHLRA